MGLSATTTRGRWSFESEEEGGKKMGGGDGGRGTERKQLVL